MSALESVGGEVHYWRLQPEHWNAVLDAAQRLGIETIGTYIPWNAHETAPGRYDFSQLQAFLDAVRTRGFRLFARPGPYIYAEWRNLGIPDHAVPYHRLHPEFQSKATTWIEAVMEVLRPRLGDFIVAVQACNEVDPFPHYYGEDLGFADWLRERYGHIEALNAAWGADYGDFSEPLPTLTAFVEDRRLHDSCRYRYDLAARYAAWVVGQYRACGCNVPMVLNTYPGVDAQNWCDFAEIADIFGLDIYPRNECRGDYRYVKERLRLLRAVTSSPYIAEFGSGIWEGVKERECSPDHYRLLTMTALAAGVRGWNWYMLVDRDNWHGGPINERGVIREPTAGAFREAVQAFNALRETPPPDTSCAVTWSWRDHQIAQIKATDAYDPLFMGTHRDPLLIALHEMGLEYDFVDVDRDFDPPRLLFVAGAIEQPERLWEYVAGGGSLVLFQNLIEGCARPDGTSHPGASNLQVSLGFVTNKPVFAYRKPPGTPLTARQLPLTADDDQARHAQQAEGRTYVCGYHEQRGKGCVLVLGCAPSRAAILAVHRFFNVEIPALPISPGIHVSRRGDKVIVLNPGEKKTARFLVNGQERCVEMPRVCGVIV